MRYRFYRVHKYVCHVLATFDQETAKTDFSNPKECAALADKFNDLISLLEDHAAYEDRHIHQLLRDKSSKVQLQVEDEHHAHAEQFANLKTLFKKAVRADRYEDKIVYGHDFYLAYRRFYSETLKHLYDEETVLLPELQRLYTDKELASLQAKTYAKMTPEQILGMLKIILPHGNEEDKQFFFAEIKQAEPEKFAMVYEKMHGE